MESIRNIGCEPQETAPKKRLQGKIQNFLLSPKLNEFPSRCSNGLIVSIAGVVASVTLCIQLRRKSMIKLPAKHTSLILYLIDVLHISK